MQSGSVSVKGTQAETATAARKPVQPLGISTALCQAEANDWLSSVNKQLVRVKQKRQRGERGTGETQLPKATTAASAGQLVPR